MNLGSDYTHSLPVHSRNASVQGLPFRIGEAEFTFEFHILEHFDTYAMPWPVGHYHLVPPDNDDDMAIHGDGYD